MPPPTFVIISHTPHSQKFFAYLGNTHQDEKKGGIQNNLHIRLQILQISHTFPYLFS